MPKIGRLRGRTDRPRQSSRPQEPRPPDVPRPATRSANEAPHHRGLISLVEPRANGRSPDATRANVCVLGQTWDTDPAIRIGLPISPAIMPSRPVPVDRQLPAPSSASDAGRLLGLARGARGFVGGREYTLLCPPTLMLPRPNCVQIKRRALSRELFHRWTSGPA